MARRGTKMTIKEVSEQLGITQDTLRYYEKVGMVPPVTRTEGGIIMYLEKINSPEDVKKLKNG